MIKGRIVGCALATLLLTGGCAAASPPSAGELAVLDYGLTRADAGSIEIWVAVKNVGTSVTELARVEVSLYDEEDALIDVFSDSIMNLRPGETWDFEFVLTETDCQDCGDVTRYDIQTFAGTSSGGI